MANHSFGGIVFRTEWQGEPSVPIVPPKKAILVTEHIPGGSLDVTQDLGMAGTIEFTASGVLVPADNWAALVALVGQSRTLAMIANPSYTAKLEEITGDIRYVLTSAGYVYRGASLKFLVS